MNKFLELLTDFEKAFDYLYEITSEGTCIYCDSELDKAYEDFDQAKDELISWVKFNIKNQE